MPISSSIYSPQVLDRRYCASDNIDWWRTQSAFSRSDCRLYRRKPIQQKQLLLPLLLRRCHYFDTLQVNNCQCLPFIHGVSKNRTSIRLIWHNFSSSQRLLTTFFGRDRFYSIGYGNVSYIHNISLLCLQCTIPFVSSCQITSIFKRIYLNLYKRGHSFVKRLNDLIHWWIFLCILSLVSCSLCSCSVAYRGRRKMQNQNRKPVMHPQYKLNRSWAMHAAILDFVKAAQMLLLGWTTAVHCAVHP